MTCSQPRTARPGLRLLDEHPGVCVLFTDVGLPGGMNGRQLAEEARRRRPDLKVLFTTGYARNAIVHDGRLDAGRRIDHQALYAGGACRKAPRHHRCDGTARAAFLLVEDEPLIQMLAVEYLEGRGFTVYKAGSATEAINTLGLLPGGVDAVVVDIGLPDRKGDELGPRNACASSVLARGLCHGRRRDAVPVTKHRRRTDRVRHQAVLGKGAYQRFGVRRGSTGLTGNSGPPWSGPLLTHQRPFGAPHGAIAQWQSERLSRALASAYIMRVPQPWGWE